MDPTENTPGIVDKACLPPRYLAIDLLFHAVGSAEICLATRCLAMGMARTTQKTIHGNTFSVVACACFGHCLEMGLHVTFLPP
jgi:hypothetical protein